jgi:hypothetical protein
MKPTNNSTPPELMPNPVAHPFKGEAFPNPGTPMFRVHPRHSERSPQSETSSPSRDICAMKSLFDLNLSSNFTTKARPYPHSVIPTGEPRLLRLAAEGSLFDLNPSSNFPTKARS